MQVSFVCLGFLVTKSWQNLICLGKQGEMGKQNKKNKEPKTAFGKKKICDAIVGKF